MAFDLEFTNAGIVIPSASEIKEELEAMFVQVFGSNISLDASTPQGQLITSLTTIIMEKNANVARVYNSFNPVTAKNDDESGLMWQDAIGNIYNMTRIPATKSTVVCNISGAGGTVIPNTAEAISVNGDIFRIKEAVTIPEAGQISVVFVAKESGAIAVGANSVNRIYTPVVGWDTVNNPSSGTIGQPAENREHFENRRIDQLGRYSSSMIESVLSYVEAVDGVSDVIVRENDTDNNKTVQGFVLSPHSCYVCVKGGNNAKIGEAIRNSKSGGCATNGSTQYVDNYGTILFDRPTEVAMTVQVTAVKTENTPDNIEDLIKSDLVNNILGLDSLGSPLRIAETCYVGRLFNALASLEVNLTNIQIKTTGDYGNKAEFNLNQLGTLSADNIEVILQ